MLKLFAQTFLFLSILGVASGCSLFGKAGGGKNAARLPREILSIDGKCSIRVPARWYAKTNLHNEAKLQAADSKGNLYLVVISESKSNFEKKETLEDYTKMITDEPPEAVKNFKASDIESIDVGDYDAQQLTVTGTLEKTKIKWLLTTVDAPKNYHQILIWTTEEKFAENRAVFEEIIESFRETEGQSLNFENDNAAGNGER